MALILYRNLVWEVSRSRLIASEACKEGHLGSVHWMLMHALGAYSF